MDASTFPGGSRSQMRLSQALMSTELTSVDLLGDPESSSVDRVFAQSQLSAPPLSTSASVALTNDNALSQNVHATVESFVGHNIKPTADAPSFVSGSLAGPTPIRQASSSSLTINPSQSGSEQHDDAPSTVGAHTGTPLNTTSDSSDHSMSPFSGRFGRSRSRTAIVASASPPDGDAMVTAAVMVWCHPPKPSSSALSRTPIFRETANIRQKMSKTGSSRPQNEVGPDQPFDYAAGYRGTGSHWLRDRSSKSRFFPSSTSASSPGQWRRASLIFRDSGNLVLLGEDRTVLHFVECSFLTTYNIHPVHESLFNRPRVLCLCSKDIASDPTSASGKPDIFLEFASDVQFGYWAALLKIYVQPRLFGRTATVEPIETHRMYRQLDMTIHEAKTVMPRWPSELMEPPKSPMHAAAPHTGMQSYFGGAERSRNSSGNAPGRRRDEREDSPGSETCSSRGASVAGSRSNSRSGSRVRHNARTALSNLQNEDVDDGSGSSRAASSGGLDVDSLSLMGDEVSSLDDTASAIVSNDNSRYVSERIAGPSATRARNRDERELFEGTLFDRYCRIRLDGILVARTSLRASAEAFRSEKFSLRDLPPMNMLVIEVLHPTQKLSTNIAGFPASTSSKYVLLGVVEIPLDSLRRNEEIEGRFPIWSTSTFPTASGQQNDEEGKVPTTHHRGIVGELKLSIKMQEEIVMSLSQYEQVQRSIHSADAAQLIQGLASTLREDIVVSHLTRIYAASGTITDSISALIDSESQDWGGKLQPELLFRANTLLSRSVDHFQRLLAPVWLDDCLGSTVRKICQEPDTARPDTAGSESGLEGQPGKRVPPVSPPQTANADKPVQTQTLRSLCEVMWQNIYSQRHRCPPDLRLVLHQIRTKVNDKFRLSKSMRPGIQGVGAFIFLRLFCAALNAPQLYGLIASQPGRGAQRKLLLLSKVLLAMASKRTAFDQDKDGELVPLNDFLRTYTDAYDDYITVVSTVPSKLAEVDLLGFRYDDDQALQDAAAHRLGQLSSLHRESVPTAPYMLDQPLALASFVSYVANASLEANSAKTAYNADRDVAAAQDCDCDTGVCEQIEEHKLLRKRSDTRSKVTNFVSLCCKIEDQAGLFVEQAGYDPKPLPCDRFSQKQERAYDKARGASTSERTTSLRAGSPMLEPLQSTSTARPAESSAQQDDTASPSRNRWSTLNADLLRSPPASPSRASRKLTSEAPVAPKRKSAVYTFMTRRGSDANLRNSSSNRDGGSASNLLRSSSRYDDLESDEALRDAYRMLQVRETSRQTFEKPSVERLQERPDPINLTSKVRAGSTSSTVLLIDSDEAWSQQQMDIVLEADDGSTFEPVYPRANNSMLHDRAVSAAPSQKSASYSIDSEGSTPHESRQPAKRGSISDLNMSRSIPRNGAQAFAQVQASSSPTDRTAHPNLFSVPDPSGAVVTEKKKRWWKP